MTNNRDDKIREKLKTVKIEISNSSLRDEKMLKGLAAIASVSIALLLIWALIFKCGSTIMLERNYYNLRYLTTEERIMWDIIPFNYRGSDDMKLQQILTTVLNCFVFAPLSFTLCFAFKRQRVLRATAICFSVSVLIEAVQIFTVWANPATEDLITNLVGTLIGCAVYCLFFRKLSAKARVRFFTALNVTLAVALIFSAVTMAIASELIFKIITGTL